jgi:hypothetical protein
MNGVSVAWLRDVGQPRTVHCNIHIFRATERPRLAFPCSVLVEVLAGTFLLVHLVHPGLPDSDLSAFNCNFPEVRFPSYADSFPRVAKLS